MTALIQRQFIALSFVTAFLFVVTGFLALSGNRVMTSSVTIQQAASHISSLAMLHVMSQEIPALAETVQASSEREPGSVTSFFFELVTSIHPGDLRSLLGRELPGLLTVDDARFIVAGKDSTLTDLYVESPALPQEEIVVTDTPATPPAVADAEPTKETSPPIAMPNTSGKKVVFVYHSHNRESFIGEAKPIGDSLDHPTRNITLVGKHLAQALNDRGIGTDVNTDDIYQRLVDQGLSFPLSYAESLKIVKAATEQNRELHYFFDLHRDEKPRKQTTTKINGKSYARVLFVIGKRNKHFEKNTEFAKELHVLLEKKYPALSRGVMEKGAKTDHGEYNQSISPGSMLVEIGGTENTLQECYNTAEALADVFADYYWQAERVDKPTSDKPAKR